MNTKSNKHNNSKHYSLASYIPKHYRVNDKVSALLLDFKSGNESTVKAWADFATSFMGAIWEDASAKPDLILRALSSKEQRCKSSSPLDYIGDSLANKYGINYIPEFLSKNRKTKELKDLNKAERQNELSNVYKFFVPDFPVKRILVIDDISTSGTTAKAIEAAISEVAESITIDFLFLGKTRDPKKGYSNAAALRKLMIQDDSQDNFQDDSQDNFQDDSQDDFQDDWQDDFQDDSQDD